MQRLRTIGLVTVVTLIVWIFAEGEVLKAEQVQVDVTLRSGSSQLWLGVDDQTNWSGRVRVTLEGPAAAIDSIRERLNDPIELLSGVELPDEAGDYSIELASTITRDQVFAGSGVTVIDAVPGTLSITIDELVRIEAIVEPFAAGERTEASASIETAILSVPGRFADRLDNPARVRAEVPEAALAALVPGRPERVPAVPLRAPEAVAGLPGVTIEPASVALRVTTRTQPAERVLQSVFVQLREPPATRELFSVTVAEGEEVLRDVRITGPARLVEQVASDPQSQPVAVLVLTPELLQRGVAEGGSLVLEARIEGLPAGVSWEATDRSVRITVARRDGG